MSKKQECLNRLGRKLSIIDYLDHWQLQFYAWLNSEPPMYRIIKWHKWKMQRPDFLSPINDYDFWYCINDCRITEELLEGKTNE